MNEPMKLTEDERSNLESSMDEAQWYKVCDQIKERSNGQYPNYLSREILDLFLIKFPPEIS
tara:strand:+ start:273 stop:455 length:183 start_codon:yes stop_codon:yes gene_type:complete